MNKEPRFTTAKSKYFLSTGLNDHFKYNPCIVRDSLNPDQSNNLWGLCRDEEDAFFLAMRLNDWWRMKQAEVGGTLPVNSSPLINELRGKITVLEELNTHLRKELNDDSIEKDLEYRVASLSRVLSNKDSALRERNAIIRDQRKSLATQNEIIAELRGTILKEKKISDRHEFLNKVKVQDAKVKQLTTELDGAKRRNEKLYFKLQDMNTPVYSQVHVDGNKKLRKDITLKDNALRERNNTIRMQRSVLTVKNEMLRRLQHSASDYPDYPENPGNFSQHVIARNEMIKKNTIRANLQCEITDLKGILSKQDEEFTLLKGKHSYLVKHNESLRVSLNEAHISAADVRSQLDSIIKGRK